MSAKNTVDVVTPRWIRDPDAPAKTIGHPPMILVGLRGPTEDEVRASIESARGRSIGVPRGVHRYRNHEEANQEMDQWAAKALAAESRAAADIMVQRGLADRKLAIREYEV